MLERKVSILVLMEGAHRQCKAQAWNAFIGVSILVLMEGAHRQSMRSGACASGLSFNPCFDGRGSPTICLFLAKESLTQVSILVLMEGAHRPFDYGPQGRLFRVSILVLMEGAHRQYRTR